MIAMKSSLNFITGNAHKLKEVKAMLEPDLEVRNQPLDLEEIQGTIEEVSRSKCRKAAEIVSPLVNSTYCYVMRLYIMLICTNCSPPGQRACLGRRYSPVLYCIRRASRAIHVRRCHPVLID